MLDQLQGFDIRGEIALLGPIPDSEAVLFLSGDRRQKIEAQFKRTRVREVVLSTTRGRRFTIPIPGSKDRKILGLKDWRNSSVEAQVVHFVYDSPFPCYLASLETGQVLIMNKEFMTSHEILGSAIASDLNIFQYWQQASLVMEHLEKLPYIEEGNEESLGSETKPYLIEVRSKQDAQPMREPCILFKTKVFGHFCVIFVGLGSQRPI